MRNIHVEPDLRIRFPHQVPEFLDGVEIGVLASTMSQDPCHFTLRMSQRSLDQAVSLASKMDYELSSWTEGDDGMSDVSFHRRGYVFPREPETIESRMARSNMRIVK